MICDADVPGYGFRSAQRRRLGWSVAAVQCTCVNCVLSPAPGGHKFEMTEGASLRCKYVDLHSRPSLPLMRVAPYVHMANRDKQVTTMCNVCCEHDDI